MVLFFGDDKDEHDTWYMIQYFCLCRLRKVVELYLHNPVFLYLCIYVLPQNQLPSEDK